MMSRCWELMFGEEIEEEIEIEIGKLSIFRWRMDG